MIIIEKGPRWRSLCFVRYPLGGYPKITLGIYRSINTTKFRAPNMDVLSTNSTITPIRVGAFFHGFQGFFTTFFHLNRMHSTMTSFTFFSIFQYFT